MKKLLFTSALLLSLTGLSLMAQNLETQEALPSFTPTENWMDVSHTCFGSGVSATWLGAMLSDGGSLWLDEAHHALVMVTPLDAASFDAQADEARTGLFSTAGTNWSLGGERAIPGTDLREVSYTLTLAGRQYPASLLLVPTETGGTIVMSIAANPVVARSQGNALAAAFSGDSRGSFLLAQGQH
jgi:hypothetical protein